MGKYHIVRPLKVGGTAAIYLAVLRGENNFSREVVIKRPLPHLVADSRARLMFIDEAHIASRLSHPNICQVLDLVAREDELYLVLEYLKGVDLREVLKRAMELGRLLPIEVATWIGIEVCAGLDFAHEAVAIDGSPLGVIHRDVSPKNIRVTDAGSVKVIDFGIARAMNRATETAAGTIKGTLGYMSPEQIMGDEIDRRSDVFAFGIVLFQMLTCRNPFDGPSLKERVRRLTQAPVPSPREYNGALDPEIEGIVMKTLERDVDKRYQRLRDVQVDLDRYLAKLQVISPRQRLIEFLEEIFPSLHETDPELKIALTEISTISGRIDTSQRLRFPDDPEREPGPSASSASAESRRPESSPVAARSTVGVGGTVSTLKDEAMASGRAPPRREAANGHDTALPMGHTVQGATAAVDRSSADGLSAISTVLGSKPIRFGGIGLLLVLVATLAAVAVVWWSDHGVSTTPIGEESKRETKTQETKPTETKPAETKPTEAKAPDTKTTETKPTETKSPEVRPAETKHAETKHADTKHADVNKAIVYFKTGVRLEKADRADDALLMYTLAFHESGKSANPAILRNLGLLYNRTNDVPKAKACLRAYLERSPSAPEGERIRTLLSSYPATKTVGCVDAADIQHAKKLAARKGTMIESWVSETVEERLR